MRKYVQLLVLLLIVIVIGSCGADSTLRTIQLNPATATMNTGDTIKLQALGTYKAGNHPSSTTDITAQVTWNVANASVATVDASGLLTAVGLGTTTINAELKNDGNLVLSSPLTVTVSGLGSGGTVGATNQLASIQLIPSSQSVTTAGETAQYIAIGTFTGSPTTKDVTNSVTWSSSDVKIATINSSGLATAVAAQGSTTIVASWTNQGTGSVITSTSTFSSQGGTGVNIPTLTIYKVGLGAANGKVKSDIGTIDCGTGAMCTGFFTSGQRVTLTASPTTGFGGWSSNCVVDPAVLTRCSVVMDSNQTVGAIFN